MENRLLNRIVSHLSKATIKSLGFIVFAFLLYCIVYICEKHARTDWFFLKLGLFDCMLWGFILCIFPSRVSFWLKIFTMLLLSSISCIDLYLWFFWGTNISPSMLQILSETNYKESREFINSFILAPKVYLLFICFCIWMTLYYILEKKITHNLLINILSLKQRLYISSIYLFSFVVISFESYNTIQIRNDFLTEKSPNKIVELKTIYSINCIYRPVFRLLYSIHSINIISNQIENLRIIASKASISESSNLSPIIVWVIGESVVKNHMSIYGYKYNTTPYQLKMRNEGSLFVFNDVITTSNTTSHVFQQIFSMHSVGQQGDWYSRQLFPTYFRKAGYNVVFYTNQYVQELGNNTFDFGGGTFINDKELSNRMFSERNTKRYDFDKELIDDFKKSYKERIHSNSLYILHLLGQHWNFDKRFPNGFKKYTSVNYSYRSDLPDNKKQIIANYDNATLYNDYVLNEIIKIFRDKDAIVLYMSDHGEEVCENNNLTGRTHTTNYDLSILNSEYSVAFWIWTSESYKKMHPEFIQQIKSSTSNSYMTDDIPHTLLYLAGIKCADYDSTRCVISPHFNNNRQRLIHGTFNYDSFMKNSCK